MYQVSSLQINIEFIVKIVKIVLANKVAGYITEHYMILSYNTLADGGITENMIASR